MARRRPKRDPWFDETVLLPPGFGGVGAIRRAIEYMEEELADLVEIYFEQANVFSAIVGIMGTRALDSVRVPGMVAGAGNERRAALAAVDHQNVEMKTRQIDGGGQPRGPATDNQAVENLLVHASPNGL